MRRDSTNVVVSELGERRLLALIRARLDATTRPPPASPARHWGSSPALVLGIGDDAAVVTPRRNAQTVLTTDAQVEGVHFERRFSGPEDLGYRALAVNLSDLAAMGATPLWVLLSLMLPDDLLVNDVEAMVGGLADLAVAHGVVVVGGNLTRSPGPLIIDVTAVGDAKPRRLLTRGGGRPGDELFVSGTIGGAAAGLEMLRRMAGEMTGLKPRPSSSTGGWNSKHAGNDDGPALRPGFDRCMAKYRRPEPRVRLGLAVARARAARAAMDLSDGLADAAQQVAEASSCGVEIDADLLPIEPGARAWWEASGKDPVLSALSGGDDYELLLATPRSWGGRLRHARSHVAEPALTRIGVLTKDSSQRVLRRDGRRERLPVGFGHFKNGE